MKFKLHEVTLFIRSGHSFRERVENDPLGDTLVIQPKDISPLHPTLLGQPQKVRSDSFSEKQILQKGDILLLAKGNKNYAWVYQLNEKAVTTALFFVIRPDSAKVSAEYLAWYINQETIQGALLAAKAGTTVTNIPLTALSELEIKIPSLLTQNKLVNLYQLWQIEKEKTLNLVEVKDRYFNNLVLAEIEREFEVEPFTDELKHWMGYWMRSNYNIADIKFRERVFIKGQTEPVKQMLAIIMHLDTHGRKIDFEDGSWRSYTAVKDWRLVEFKNLRAYNDTTTPQKEREEKYMNVIPHSMIEGVVMRDRFGNIIPE